MRKIHSLQSLRNFEAAARHLSFKSAAVELCVTPTAVSHHIKKLEEQLDCQLFERKTRRVILTAQGQELFNALYKSFNEVDEVIEQIKSHRERDVVTLGLGSIIGTRWLAPRLGDFWSSHPDIDLRLHHTLLPRHQDTDRFDLAIAWGDGNWTTSEFIPFIQIQVTPVLSPELKQPRSISDLFDYPLIHQSSRDSWQQWFQSAGIEQDIDRTGMVIEDANLILQAALDGQGVALGILPFVQDELSNGRLIRPFELSIDPGQAYYLLYRESMLEKPAVRTVRDWLVEQVGG